MNEKTRERIAHRRMDFQTADALGAIILRVDAAYALLDTISEQRGLDCMTRNAIFGVEVLVDAIARDLRNVKEKGAAP